METPSPPGAADGRATRPGSWAARGGAWMLLNTAWSRAGSIVSQVVLGWILLPQDFGLFAAAGAVALIARSFQDAGVRDFLVQRGSAYGKISVDAFWLALAVNISIAALLFAVSPLVAGAYGESELIVMLGIIALSVPLGTPWTIISAKLQIDLRFRSWAAILMLGALTQHGGMVVCAWLGFGALSFVLPLPVMSIAMSIAGWLVTAEKPWSSRPNRDTWMPILAETKWLILAAAAAALFTQGDYLIVGAIVSTSVLGVYYFAYQIPAQVGAVAASLGDVLLPVLVGAAGSPQRERDLLDRALGLLTVVTSAACVLIAVLMPRIEHLVWSNRWEEAVVPIQILALLMPFRLIYIVPKTALLSRGRFQFLSLALVVGGCGLVAAAGTGASIDPNAKSIALVVGGYLAVSVVAFSMLVLRSYGISPWRILKTVIGAWLVAVIAGAAAYAAGSFQDSGGSDVANLALESLSFAAAFAVVARLALPNVIRSSSDLLGQSAGRRVRKLLMLS